MKPSLPSLSLRTGHQYGSLSSVSMLDQYVPDYRANTVPPLALEGILLTVLRFEC
jgi:hypothetical protein